MGLPSTGPISMSNINLELGFAFNAVNRSLFMDANAARVGSTPYTNKAQPKISHWYGYATTRVAFNIDTTNSGSTGKEASYIFTDYDFDTGMFQNDARFVPLYSSGTLIVGSTLYTSSTGTTTFNGNSLWYQLQGGTNPKIYQISSAGAILAIYNSVYESPNVLPSTVTGMTGARLGTGSSRSLQLTWTATTDNDMIHHYNLYVRNVGDFTTSTYHLVKSLARTPTISGTSRSIVIFPMPYYGGAPTTWWVTAVDISGNESAASNTYYESTGGTW
jgi:hypothetical protein